MPEGALPTYDLRGFRDQELSANDIRWNLLDAGEQLPMERHMRANFRAGASAFARAIAEQGGTIQAGWENTPNVRALKNGGDVPKLGTKWWAPVRAATATRLVCPTWPVISRISVDYVLRLLPASDPLHKQRLRLNEAMGRLGSISDYAGKAPSTLLKLMLVNGYDAPEEITEQDMLAVGRGGGSSRKVLAVDYADAVLCALGVFDRTTLRGFSRTFRTPSQPTVEQVIARRQVPERFEAVTVDYLKEAIVRFDYAHSTVKHRAFNIARFWKWIDENHPEIQSAAEITPEHGRSFVEATIAHSRSSRRGIEADSGKDDRLTPYSLVGDVKTAFQDLAAWALEPGSPFAGRVPAVAPIKNRDVIRFGLRRGTAARQEAKMQRHVLDLERELPGIRAYALATWSEAREAFEADPENHKAMRQEGRMFWRWALLELFIQAGLRIEEALELTTLDVLKRQLPDGRLYYLLHIKPSKNGRARLLPIGDELGRLIAEIVRHVKAFYGGQVPAIDTWDMHENKLRPRAPYLLQANGHPRAIAPTTVRELLKEVSLEAGAKRADGSPIYLRPHDGRRVFASEHLNHNTPVHVIAALLGHAGLETVMVYAKLYPKTLVEEYKKAVRGSFITATGPDSLKNPTPKEWAEFERSCSLRDMGTHVCALPTGDHCERGLVCLGCNHAQPKRSAEPVFARMLTSHRRELAKAEDRNEPAGQLAARELEVHRIESALRRTRALPLDVASAIEATV